MKAAIYARVSTDDQDVSNQIERLKQVADRNGWELVEIYTDNGVSGAKGRSKRPGLDAMLTAVVRKEFNVLMVWSVDRLGRSLQQLVSMLDDFHAKSIDLYIHQQGIDTTTPGGKALYQMCGVFAEFEREMIRERVKAGLAKAKAKGKKLGRRGIDLATRNKVKALRKDGNSIRKIAGTTGLSVGAVHKILA